jgi:hypothetical protein
MNAELLCQLESGSILLERFGGHVPSFHDAEILRLTLLSPDHVRAVCYLTIESNEMMPLNPDGTRQPDIRQVVEFELRGVSDLRLCDFYRQNVINKLSITRGTDGTSTLEMEYCAGLHGMLQAQEIRIALPAG